MISKRIVQRRAGEKLHEYVGLEFIFGGCNRRTTGKNDKTGKKQRDGEENARGQLIGVLQDFKVLAESSHRLDGNKTPKHKWQISN